LREANRRHQTETKRIIGPKKFVALKKLLNEKKRSENSLKEELKVAAVTVRRTNRARTKSRAAVAWTIAAVRRQEKSCRRDEKKAKINREPKTRTRKKRNPKISHPRRINRKIRQRIRKRKKTKSRLIYISGCLLCLLSCY
jgi:hypothetical protein